MVRQITLAIAYLVAASVGAAHATDPCAPPLPGMNVTPEVTKIKIVNADPGDVDDDWLDYAVGKWDSACGSSAGRSLPDLTTTGSADFQVGVVFKNRKCPIPNCMCAFFRPVLSNSTGHMIGGQIKLFAKDSNGVECEASNYDDFLKHELGHVLGLDNVSASGCDDRVMRDFNDDPKSSDCLAAGERWFTPHEQQLIDNNEGHPCQNPQA